MSPSKELSSDLSKASVPELLTLPDNVPLVSDFPICRTLPLSMVVPPEWPISPLIKTMLSPVRSNVPVPVMSPANSPLASVLLKTSLLLLSTSPVIEPPSAICSVPALMMVPPE